MAKTLYEDLGVLEGASDAEIRCAYKSRARELHPDKSSGDTQRFQDLGAAYQTLSDRTARREYDQSLQTRRKLFSTPSRRPAQSSNTTGTKAAPKPAESQTRSQNTAQPKQNSTRKVYVTPGGECYHMKSSCHGMRSSNSVTCANVGDVQRDGRRPCKFCAQSMDHRPSSGYSGTDAGAIVYGTATGKCYHRSSSCSGLRRARSVIRLTGAQGLKPCKLCA